MAGPARVVIRDRDDLVRELERQGFRLVEEEFSGRTVLWAGGIRYGYIPKRVTAKSELARHYVQAMRFLRDNGLAWTSEPCRPEPPAPHVSTVEPMDTGQDLVELRRAATIESVGLPRAERAARWRLYVTVYSERFNVRLDRRTPPEWRPKLGRCPSCDVPEEQDCVESCPLVDPLKSIFPDCPPRQPRPWMRHARK